MPLPSRLEFAVTPAQIERGLSGRPHLDFDQGMLFVASYPDWFWMPDMHFPIDIIWLDRKWTVVDIAEHVPPCIPGADEECPKYLPDADFAYVLEVAAGFAKTYGIQIGHHI